MRLTSIRVLGVAMIIGLCSVAWWSPVAADVVDSDTKPIGLEVTGNGTASPTPDGSPVATPTVPATVVPTATTPAVNKLPDTGSQGGTGETTALLVASAAIVSAVAAYGVRRGVQRAA